MIITIGKARWGQTVHYGQTAEPNSVKCGNWYSTASHFRWTNEKNKVTCKKCLKSLRGTP